MKKLFSFIIFMIYSSSFAQNCTYQVAINSENLKGTGKFKLTIKNTDSQSFKIPKKINLCNMRLIDLEMYNESKKSFEKINLAKKDIDCFDFKDKSIKLKPAKANIYTVDIKSDLAVLQSTDFFETFNDRKYRFKISFPLDSYARCGESNKLITDWVYKN
ncbi:MULTISPECIES: hypothetical protein [unclassified Chryseobacterium]|uniref:hypothetical protein n=1 Tax=unclassified Chryseobacterium TaxID=2593645 RepID=UPI00103A9820|nr:MULTISPECIES: hypothetical protein [unclassified Chryseobacterium]